MQAEAYVHTISIMEISDGEPESGSGSGAPTETSCDDFFVKHRVGEVVRPTDLSMPNLSHPTPLLQVTKLDTLAGLAIRYNVTVSDIKRANGLLSEITMYARDSLLIPTRPLPVDPQYSTWAGMIVTHYGRVTPPDLHHLGDVPYQQMAPHHSSIAALRGYYSTGPSPPASPQRASSAGEDDEFEGRRLLSKLNGTSKSWQNLGEVELMSRGSSAGVGGSSTIGSGMAGFSMPERQPLFRSAPPTQSSGKWKEKLKIPGPSLKGAAHVLAASAKALAGPSSSNGNNNNSGQSRPPANKTWSDRKTD